MVYLNWRQAAGEGEEPQEDTRRVSPVGTFFIVLFVLLVVGAIGWVVFTQLRARRLGLPAPSWSSYNPFSRSEPSSYGGPSPASGGIFSRISDKFNALRRGGSGGNSRSAPGAYERRGFGPLDPDEAWDARVGHEADAYHYGGGGYEQELRTPGHMDNSSRYQGSGGRGFDGYDMNLGGDIDDDDNHYHRQGDIERGRPRSRSPGPARNPFDDAAAEPSNVSLRGVSPRPIDTAAARMAAAHGGGGPHSGGSPVSERRSIFRENV